MEGGGKLGRRSMGLRGSLTRPISWTHMHDIIHERSGNVVQDKVIWTVVIGYRIYSLGLHYNLDLGIASFFGFWLNPLALYLPGQRNEGIGCYRGTHSNVDGAVPNSTGSFKPYLSARPLSAWLRYLQAHGQL
jgi:hypothetical protein